MSETLDDCLQRYGADPEWLKIGYHPHTRGEIDQCVQRILRESSSLRREQTPAITEEMWIEIIDDILDSQWKSYMAFSGRGWDVKDIKRAAVHLKGALIKMPLIGDEALIYSLAALMTKCAKIDYEAQEPDRDGWGAAVFETMLNGLRSRISQIDNKTL